MSVIGQIKEIISPETCETAMTAWAERWFAAPHREVAVGVAQAIISVVGGDLERLNPGTRLVDDLSLTELQRVQLLVGVEEKFGLKIPDHHAECTYTIGQLVECIQGQRQKPEATPEAEEK